MYTYNVVHNRNHDTSTRDDLLDARLLAGDCNQRLGLSNMDDPKDGRQNVVCFALHGCVHVFKFFVLGR